jgi:phosphoribosyl 1,2-cyclic phosphodiesterase
MIANNQDSSLKIRFWGVRGSIPTPGSDFCRTGGNTSCVVLQFGQEPVVVIDGGTGLRLFGRQLKWSEEQPLRATLLFSHFHWDHIQGFPFFGPIYSRHAELSLWSGVPARELQTLLTRQMCAPFFPVSYSEVPARCDFHRLEAGGFSPGSLQITPVTLNHPGSATGFRIDSPAGSVIYVSDHEHGNTPIDEQIQRKASGCDVMIYDAHFTPEEYPSFKGWGHSTWLQGAQIAAQARVGKLMLFHHSPDRTDREVDEIVGHAREIFPQTYAAVEGGTLSLQKK